MLKNLLRDKDNEVEHYRKTAETIAAQAGGEIKVPPPPPSWTFVVYISPPVDPFIS